MSHYRRILVVTPTLGDSVFLDETVSSVGTQLLDILHVISAPAEKQRILQARFPHAVVVPDGGKAGGIYGALNAALAHVTAGWDWFTYINDDDILLPGFSEVFYRHMRSVASQPVIYGDVDLVDENGRTISRVTTERDPAWIPALLQQGISPLMQQGMLFRRDVVRKLKGFDLRYRLCADLDFWLRAYAGGSKFRYYPTRVAQFRLRSGQLSGNTAATRHEQDEIVKRHLPIPITPWYVRYARWRYRAFNLPRYLERTRTRGFRTSYQLLRATPSNHEP
jgi:GT2 family glycosyltransferase